MMSISLSVIMNFIKSVFATALVVILTLFMLGTQVENYGPVPAGKHRKSLERGSSIPTGKFSDFFR
jgi:hypothetical protein